MSKPLPTNIVGKHFISTDPVTNALDTQFNLWKQANPLLFISYMHYQSVGKTDGSIEHSLFVAGYDTSSDIPQNTPAQ